jgi:hypothetical protein
MQPGPNAISQSAVEGGAFVFTVLLWTAMAFVIWLFVRKRHRFGVVWIYTNLTVGLLVLISGSSARSYSSFASLIILIAILRFIFVAVGWIVKKLSKNKFGVFQVSRICWIVVLTLFVLLAVVARH